MRGVGWTVLGVNAYEGNHRSVQGRHTGECTYTVASWPRCVVVRRLEGPPRRVEPINRFTEKNLATDRVGFELVARVEFGGSHW